jgi:hypothetical protein
MLLEVEEVEESESVQSLQEPQPTKPSYMVCPACFLQEYLQTRLIYA